MNDPDLSSWLALLKTSGPIAGPLLASFAIFSAFYRSLFKQTLQREAEMRQALKDNTMSNVENARAGVKLAEAVHSLQQTLELRNTFDHFSIKNK